VPEDRTRKVTELKPDTGNLYREETFTDMHVATVRRFTPVTPEGAEDRSRPTQYVGETTLMTQVGPVPVTFVLEARTLGEAFRKFPEGVQQAVEQLNERAKQLVRDEASRIVVPTAAPRDMAGPGLPGSSKIVLK
jgi:hypothetical protein